MGQRAVSILPVRDRFRDCAGGDSMEISFSCRTVAIAGLVANAVPYGGRVDAGRGRSFLVWMAGDDFVHPAIGKSALPIWTLALDHQFLGHLVIALAIDSLAAESWTQTHPQSAIVQFAAQQCYVGCVGHPASDDAKRTRGSDEAVLC